MKTGLVAAAALAAGLTACAKGEFRYTPLERAVPLSAMRMTRISAIDYRDASGGLSEAGASLELQRPFFEVFRDGVRRRLGDLGVGASEPGGTLVDVELTKAELRASPGSPEVTATVEYAVVARGGLDAVCRQEVSEWSVSGPTQSKTPAEDALQKALAKAVDRLGPAIADSCLYSPIGGVKAAAYDPEARAKPRMTDPPAVPAGGSANP